jgi:hypothetical protein
MEPQLRPRFVRKPAIVPYTDGAVGFWLRVTDSSNDPVSSDARSAKFHEEALPSADA